jgi:hypothetical protein
MILRRAGASGPYHGEYRRQQCWAFYKGIPTTGQILVRLCPPKGPRSMNALSHLHRGIVIFPLWARTCLHRPPQTLRTLIRGRASSVHCAYPRASAKVVLALNVILHSPQHDGFTPRKVRSWLRRPLLELSASSHSPQTNVLTPLWCAREK